MCCYRRGFLPFEIAVALFDVDDIANHLSQEWQCLAIRPIRHTALAIDRTDRVQLVPVMRQDLASGKKMISITIDMMRFAAGTIKFEDKKMLSLFQIGNGLTTYIIPAVQKSGHVTQLIKYAQQIPILFRFQAHQLSATAEI